MPSEMLPCPFCLSSDLWCASTYLICRACEATGPTILDARDDVPTVEAWNCRAEPPCPPEVERLAAAARVLLDRYNAYNFPEDWEELEAALAPFERPATGDSGKSSRDA